MAGLDTVGRRGASQERQLSLVDRLFDTWTCAGGRLETHWQQWEWHHRYEVTKSAHGRDDIVT